MRRMFWLGLGVVAGASGTVWAERKVKERIDALSPDSLAVAAGARARSAGRTVVAAVAEGRGAMRDRETQMRRDRGWPDGVSARPRPDAWSAESHRRHRPARHH